MGLPALPSHPGARSVEEATIRPPRVALRYFDGCPNWQTTLTRLKALLAALDEGNLEITLERVETPEDAQRLRFVGSPTILLNGRDPFEEPEGEYGLACRIYRTPEGPAGSPTTEQLREALSAYLDQETS
jgi:hypothetical protein